MIKEAAILKGKRIFVGKRHSDCFQAMKEAGISFSRPKPIQGFVTSEGVFVDRQEAFEIAVSCRQIKDPGPGKTRTLVSEDLY